MIGLEAPENHLHTRFLPELSEDCRRAAEDVQVLVATHSPHFVDGLMPGEVWILDRDRDGFATGKRASEIQEIREFMDEGAKLGQLWTEGGLDAY